MGDVGEGGEVQEPGGLWHLRIAERTMAGIGLVMSFGENLAAQDAAIRWAWAGFSRAARIQ